MALPILLDDLPTLNDSMGWGQELSRIKIRILSCPTPHVLGIHGNWGSGKTSFMRQLQNSLGGDIPNDRCVNVGKKQDNAEAKKMYGSKIVTIWFEAWRYQNEPMPVVALLQEMRTQMWLLRQIQDKFKKLGTITLKYTLDSLADIGKAIGFEGLPSAEKIERIGSDWEKENYQEELSSNSIRKVLTDTIQALLPTPKSKVIIFIDDLDRCNPKAAMRLLEGLKIYLSIPNCVFVIGMNESILVDAIREEISAPKEASREEMKLRASHYLEKICGDIYRLPLPSDPNKIFASWIGIIAQRNALERAVDGLQCLPPNARRLKSLSNQWERFAQLLPFPLTALEEEIWAAKILITSYINQFHRDIWERWHFNADFWVDLKSWCEGERFRNALGGKQDQPEWASALKLTGTIVSEPSGEAKREWKSGFPNPGDIEVFWVDSLIRKFSDQLVVNDFKLLLK